MRTLLRTFPLLVACLVFLGGWTMAMPAAWAHWADQAAAQIWVNDADVQVDLTFPTGLAAFADRDRNQQLSTTEIQTHSPQLVAFFSERIRLTNSRGQEGVLTLSPLDLGQLPPALRTAPSTHATLRLVYRWPQPLRGVKIEYDLFLPGVPTASCLATLLQQGGRIQSFIFTPQQRTLAFTPGLRQGGGGLLWVLASAFVWGALHSLSPGHGKTLVGAYLVGERATPRHALFLALTTTVTHTLGVFALGLVTLTATRWVLPETLYPWLSLVSGLLVISIGWNLLSQRLKSPLGWRFRPNLTNFAGLQRPGRDLSLAAVYAPSTGSDPDHPDAAALGSVPRSPGTEASLAPWPAYAQGDPLDLADAGHGHSGHPHGYTHDPAPAHSPTHSPAHSHEHSHGPRSAHSHKHSHDHDHGHGHHGPSPAHPHGHDHDHAHDLGHGHSHLPPGCDGTAVTWRSLLALGISGGLVPCPAALVLMLSAISIGQVSLGLLLVLAFSLGLAGVLMGLGLLMVHAKRLFTRVPRQVPWLNILPLLSAAVIALMGTVISGRAVFQLLQGL